MPNHFLLKMCFIQSTELLKFLGWQILQSKLGELIFEFGNGICAEANIY